MKLGIMQPYFLPYIGYWQLMNAVDLYVIYDDVTFIKQGWINRNRILMNGKDFLISIPLSNASSYKQINQTEIILGNTKLVKTIEQAYKKAPFFKDVFPLMEAIINYQEQNLARYVTHSICLVTKYFGIKTQLMLSSELNKDNKLKAQDKVLHICKNLEATEYFNAVGGLDLYSKDAFSKAGISLVFLKTKPIIYKQFKHEFVPWLSILDVMMFNSVDEIKVLLNSYELL